MDREMMNAIESVCGAVDALLGMYSASEEKDPLLRTFLTKVCRARSELVTALTRRQDEKVSQLLEDEI